MQPQNPFYRLFSLDCNRAQICVNLFIFGSSYTDISSLSINFLYLAVLSKYSGGCLYYYPNFDGSRKEDSMKFSSELSHFLTRTVGLEAVLRCRATKGKSL